MAERILCPEKFTYSAGTAAFASVASATDIFEIRGAADRKIQVLGFKISATQTTGGTIFLAAIKRSTADSGGTAAAATKVPRNSRTAASTATVQSYTANPTTGTAVGNIFSGKVYVPGVAEIIVQPVAKIDFREIYGIPVQLNDATESVCINLNGVTVTGGSWVITVSWLEELTKPVGT